MSPSPGKISRTWPTSRRSAERLGLAAFSVSRLRLYAAAIDVSESPAATVCVREFAGALETSVDCRAGAAMAAHGKRQTALRTLTAANRTMTRWRPGASERLQGLSDTGGSVIEPVKPCPEGLR